MRLIVDQSLVAGFISIYTRQQRASLPFKPYVLKRNVRVVMRLIVDQSLATGFIPINTLQRRALLPFKPCVMERNVSQCG